MEIHVKDNAINSLEVGLKFYNEFLDNVNNIDISIQHFGNLKFAVIAIHNAIELLTKAVLLDINEFLVFKTDTEKDPILCNMLREQYYKKRNNAHIAYNAVLSEKAYKTIGYSNCITLIRKIFNDKIRECDYQTMYNLSEYRNALTHLGYASVYGWYKILVVLNKSLELILKFYAHNLIKAKRYFDKEIINNIVITLKKSQKNILEIWMASNEYILEKINNLIDLYLNNSVINIVRVEQDEEYKLYQKINFIYTERDIDIKWKFIYSYLNESIIISDINGLIVGFISLTEENLVFSYDDEGLPENLVDVSIFVPKNKLYFKEDKIYNMINRQKINKFQIKSDFPQILVNIYLKKLDN